MSEEKKKRRFGLFRWIVLGLVILGALAAFIGPAVMRPANPAVILAPEAIWPGANIFGVPFTNTMLATLIADVILLWLGYSAYRFLKGGNLQPSGVYNAFETIFEFLWSSVEGAAGKWAKRIAAVVMTIFLLILVANLIKLFPGFESIGYLEQPARGAAYAPVPLFRLGSATVYALDPSHKVDAATAETVEGSHALCQACQVIPFLRGSATDLNFTVALAIIAVVMTQVYGVMAVGPGYFSKFFAFGKLATGGVFGMVDFLVGFLELILEFAKILSFSFRLFGNVFAGALLLSILGSLVPIMIPAGLYLFELFFGVIQAYIFFLLATMFISMAMAGHGEGEPEEAQS